MLRVSGAMPRPLDGIARRDGEWFLAHPKRHHLCRRPAPCEFDLYDGYRGGRLIVAVRHLGRGRVLYQPLLLHGSPPLDEDAAAALFAHAAEHPDPIPEVDLVADSPPPPAGPRS
jgi:hypothetical protein